MKIVVVSQIFHPVSFRINDIVEGLTAAGHTVKVVTGLPDYGLKTIPKEYRLFRKRRERVLGAEVVRVPTIGRRTGVFWRAFKLYQLCGIRLALHVFCKAEDVDVIFCYETSPVLQAIPAIRLRNRTKTRLVLYCLDLWPESLKAWNVKETGLLYRLMSRISGRIYRTCDAIPVSSPPFIQYLIDVCNVQPEKLSYVPQHGEEMFTAVSGIYEDNQCIDFLFAGNIGAVQSVETLIEAVSLMTTTQAFRLHIVGDGSRLKACRDLADNLGLQDKITFHGRHAFSEMPRFFRLADCFLTALAADNAISNTIPGKVQSYLSMGKPILAAGGEEVNELIRSIGCGDVCEPERPDQLAVLMDDCVENFSRYKEMGLSGKAYFDQHFTKDVFIDRMLEILKAD